MGKMAQGVYVPIDFGASTSNIDLNLTVAKLMPTLGR